MSLSSEIQDYFERTSLGSLEQIWTTKFIQKLQSHKSIHSLSMKKEMSELHLNQKALQLSIQEFYNGFPELVDRYSYLDADNILEDGYVYSQVSFNLLNREYLFKYKVGDDFDFLNVNNSKESIEKKMEDFHKSKERDRDISQHIDFYFSKYIIFILNIIYCQIGFHTTSSSHPNRCPPQDPSPTCPSLPPSIHLQFILSF